MIETPGTITAIDGDRVIVRIDQQGCGRCHEEGGCGGNNLGNLLHRGAQVFTLKNPGSVHVGDCVTITIAEGSVLKTATRTYVIPLLSLLIGAFAGLSLAGEGGAIAGAIVGLSSAWFCVQKFNKPPPEPKIKH